MKARILVLLASLAILGGCARSVMPTGYLEHTGLSRAGMNSVWTLPGDRLASVENILVKEFSTERTPGDNPAISKRAKSAMMRSELISALKRRGKNATDEETDLPAGAPRLVIEGNMAQINPGSRALRYWVGFGAGRSLVEVECRVLRDSNGQATECAEFSVAKSKFIGVWGGDGDKFIDDGIRDIAKLISDYICRN